MLNVFELGPRGLWFLRRDRRQRGKRLLSSNPIRELKKRKKKSELLHHKFCSENARFSYDKMSWLKCCWELRFWNLPFHVSNCCFEIVLIVRKVLLFNILFYVKLWNDLLQTVFLFKALLLKITQESAFSSRF